MTLSMIFVVMHVYANLLSKILANDVQIAKFTNVSLPLEFCAIRYLKFAIYNALLPQFCVARKLFEYCIISKISCVWVYNNSALTRKAVQHNPIFGHQLFFLNNQTFDS